MGQNKPKIRLTFKKLLWAGLDIPTNDIFIIRANRLFNIEKKEKKLG
jgi:hypothetical protein